MGEIVFTASVVSPFFGEGRINSVAIVVGVGVSVVLFVVALYVEGKEKNECGASS